MRIYTKKGDSKLIAERFNVSLTMVTMSLNFWKNGVTARRIRDYAINELKCPIKED